MSDLSELDQMGLNEVLLAEDRAVLVDFWSPWCAPCLRLRPHLEKLAEGYSEKVRLVAVNIDQHEAVGEKYDVQSLPTLVLMKGGETLHRFVGPTLPSSIEEHFRAL